MKQANGAVTCLRICIPKAWCDEQGRMHPDTLVAAMQNAAGQHLTDRGVSAEALAKQGCLLGLLWTELRVERLPTAGETVYLRVWFGEKKHGMYPAHYECLDIGGKTLARMASWWIAIDRESRVLTSSPEVMWQLPCHSEDGEFFAPMQIPFPTSLPCHTGRTVQRQEIDHNDHMNNAHYIKWARELPESTFPRHRLTKLWAEYRKELLEGQRVTMQYGRENGTLYVVGSRDGETAFQLRMEYAQETL